MPRWKNWYRLPLPKEGRMPSTPTCTLCGERIAVGEDRLFTNHHCGQDGEGFVSEEEARSYAPRIFNYCEWVGSFPVGQRPKSDAEGQRLKEQ